MNASDESVGRYYENTLSAERLRRCYELASPRVRRYLDAEIEFVLEQIRDAMDRAGRLLELGCGYGRALAGLARAAETPVGIDTSLASLLLCRVSHPGLQVMQMDAVDLGFCDRSFDATVCIQNGISAFHANKQRLVEEAVRVTRPGGIVLFSSYADAFWEERLGWFRIQADHGLVGEIDESSTRDGTIVCTDGFTAGTVRPDEFRALCYGIAADADVVDVDGSSVFCIIRPA